MNTKAKHRKFFKAKQRPKHLNRRAKATKYRLEAMHPNRRADLLFPQPEKSTATMTGSMVPNIRPKVSKRKMSKPRLFLLAVAIGLLPALIILLVKCSNTTISPVESSDASSEPGQGGEGGQGGSDAGADGAGGSTEDGSTEGGDSKDGRADADAKDALDPDRADADSDTEDVLDGSSEPDVGLPDVVLPDGGCPEGWQLCEDACVELTSFEHCGRCGNRCPDEAVWCAKIDGDDPGGIQCLCGGCYESPGVCSKAFDGCAPMYCQVACGEAVNPEGF